MESTVYDLLINEETLYTKLYRFIDKAGWVSLEHVYKMFNKYDKNIINTQLESLLNDALISQDESTNYLRTKRPLKPEKRNQSAVSPMTANEKAIFNCLWVLCNYGYDKIIDFFPGVPYPNQVTFIDNNYEVYQLTYVDPYNIDILYKYTADLKKAKQPVCDASISRIAVVKNADLGKRTQKLNYFEYYILITDDEGFPKISYCEYDNT